MVRTTIRLRLFAFSHDHFLGTHDVHQLCDAQAPARSHRDARRRRRWWGWTRWTRRTRRRLGRLGRRRGWRIWWRRKLGREGRLLPGRGLHRASGTGGVWPLGSQRPERTIGIATRGSRAPAIAHECYADGLDRADRVTVAIALMALSARRMPSGLATQRSPESALDSSAADDRISPAVRERAGPARDSRPNRDFYCDHAWGGSVPN
jgi:hypothetical protein